ncbi:MAG: arcadin 1 [Thermofilaceae archaeon]
MSGETPVKFKAVVTNISIVDTHWGERIVKVDLTEERETPSAVIMPAEQSELAREIAPVISQIFRAMPLFGASGRARLPRLSLYLTEEEWEKLIERPTIGDLMEVEISKGFVGLRKA